MEIKALGLVLVQALMTKYREISIMKLFADKYFCKVNAIK